MLLEHLPALEGKRIVLASASPRRRELLQQMGLKFEVGQRGNSSISRLRCELGD
jgi:hypothetical protein